MRELVYYIAVTLDGYIADPQGGYDAFVAELDPTSAAFQDYADALPAHVLAALGIEPPGTRFDTVIMGWNTLTPALEIGIDSPYSHLRQVVASRRARSVAPDVTLTSDPVATVRELKAQSGLDIYLCGGGELAGALLPQIDRLVLKRNPLVFGSGIPLFGNTPYVPRRFTLESTQPFDSGVIIEQYVAQASS